MEKMTWDGPRWVREALFPANPDLAGILGRTDLDFHIFFDLFDSEFLDFQVTSFPKPGLGLGPGLGAGLPRRLNEVLEASSWVWRVLDLGEMPEAASEVWRNASKTI